MRSGDLDLEKWLKISVFILILFCTSVFSGEKIPVYFSSSRSVQIIEKTLSSSDGKYEFTVFAKYKDFETYVEQNKPTTIITSDNFKMTEILYKKKLSFTNQSSSETKLILYSLDNKWQKNEKNEGKIGLIEFGNRNEIKKYLETKFEKNFKMIKTVSKAEDLFPLLVFKSVDFVAMEPYIYEELKSQFNVQVFEVGSSATISLPSVFQSSDADPEILNYIKKIPITSLKEISFDGVK